MPNKEETPEINPEHEELIEEMARRTEADGIPRHITTEGKIMKNDWELNVGDAPDLDEEQLEAHLQDLLDAQQKENND